MSESSNAIDVQDALASPSAYLGKFVRLKGQLIVYDSEHARLVGDVHQALDASRCVGLHAPTVLKSLFSAKLGPYVGGQFTYNDDAVIEGLAALAPFCGFPLYLLRIESVLIKREGVITSIKC